MVPDKGVVLPKGEDNGNEASAMVKELKCIIQVLHVFPQLQDHLVDDHGLVQMLHHIG